MMSPWRYRSLLFGINLRHVGVLPWAMVFCALTTIASHAQTLNTLASFAGANGSSPQASLVQAANGNFYGTTILGGNLNCAYGCGTVFTITSSGSLTPLHLFCTQANCPDGNNPAAGLVQGADGNFYGTTSGDDPFDSGGGFGTIFKITAGGTLTTLHDFSSGCGITCPNGAEPAAGLVLGRDGNFYGTTEYQGVINCTQGCGTIFKITPGGSLTKLHSFTGTDGSHPVAALVQGTDGNFYGTTSTGGSSTNCSGGCGTVFKMSPSGSLIWIYSFRSNGDGAAPAAGLVQGSDGNFYGTTSGGLFAKGTVFKITPGGLLTALHSFSGTDGSHPLAGLVRGSDGNFYGTTSNGGTGGSCNGGCGTIFKITPSGSLTTLHTFSGADGSYPSAALVRATDNNFYGTTAAGGSNSSCDGGCGTVFRLFVGGSMTTVTSAPNPSTSGQLVSITATVSPGGPPTPTGTVAFSTNGTPISGCTAVSLSSAMAQCMTTALPTGTDNLVAAYSGDSTYQGSSGMVTQFVNPTPNPLQLFTVTPCRLVDTRGPQGPFGGPAMLGNSSRSFPLPQNTNCNIPGSAVAYSLNVTVAPHRPLGYLTIWPTGEGQPVVSTMNSPDGRVKANAAIVPAGTSGAVSVYVTDTTDVIIDIDGYFAPPGTQSLQFYPLTPCRVIDTRRANGHLGGPFLPAQMERDFPVLESSCLPTGVTIAAYSMNFTVAPHPSGQPLGYLTVWPQGSPQPNVSTLNNPTATVVANAAIVPAGSNGGIATYPFNSTDLIVDINGYFAAPAQGGVSFYAVAPCRAFDSRANFGQPFTGQIMVNVVGGPCAPPGNAAGYVFNATVVPSASLGYLTLWPDGQTQPVVSTLNAYDGFITSNMAIVPNQNGSTDAFAAPGNPGPGSGYTQLILDISGYFAP